MSYEAALGKAWTEIERLSAEKSFAIKFFSEEYSVDAVSRKIMSLSCNVLAKDFVSILLLHYLEQKLKGLPALSKEWISFKELESGEAYYPAFRKRAIEPILRKYGSNPEAIIKESNPKIGNADAAIVKDAFTGVPVMVEIWKGDDEFKAEANILFDRSIAKIFCTEDVAVLSGFVAKYV
ncbi:MAG: DUF3786 domain-containing protein [Candidatus Omnitrophica bacterium]|nr:DUF3786 domain-containing protein [Candidatus Omnitrophota bacterium]